MAEQDKSPTNEGPWWLSNQGTPTGPHSEAFLLVGLKTGAVSSQTYACPSGSQEWKRLCDWPAFASACPAAAPPPPWPQMQPKPAPWDPQVIAWLGLLFSPIWAGIMAAVNAKRLQFGMPIWRPVVVSVGATLVDVYLVSDRFTYSIFPDVCLYLATLWLIWRLDLRPQCAPFASWRAGADPSARWLWPGLAGSPLALVVLSVFIVCPLTPLEPRQICERFAAANSLSEEKQYTSSSFWPALEVMDAHKSGPDTKEQFDLTAEEDAPANVGGHLVGYRLRREHKGADAELVEGFFHLQNRDGAWKIEDLYVTSVNSQQTPEPVSIAANYRQLFPEAAHPVAEKHSASSTTTAKTTTQNGWLLTRWLFSSGAEKAASGEAKALASEGSALARNGEKAIASEGTGLLKGLKGLGAALMAALAGLASLAKWLFGSNNSFSQSESKAVGNS